MIWPTKGSKWGLTEQGLVLDGKTPEPPEAIARAISVIGASFD
jgi:hypothetical protein